MAATGAPIDSVKTVARYGSVVHKDDTRWPGYDPADGYNVWLDISPGQSDFWGFVIDLNSYTRTDIIPGDPAKFLSLNAGWENHDLFMRFDNARKRVGIITAISATVRPQVLDADADGVPDDRDQCVNTAGGASVDSNGCSPAQLDADLDGVPNTADKCPASPTGSTVDANGCTPAQAIDLAVPCAGPIGGGTWSSHGAYVAAVTKIADQLLAAGTITTGQHGQLVSARAGSTCGSRTVGS